MTVPERPEVASPQPGPAGGEPGLPGPTPTGLTEVDAALGDLADLDATPLGEHPERLARAHEVLHAQLQDRPGAGG